MDGRLQRAFPMGLGGRFVPLFPTDIHDRTSMARTLMARLPWLFRTRA